MADEPCADCLEQIEELRRQLEALRNGHPANDQPYEDD